VAVSPLGAAGSGGIGFAVFTAEATLSPMLLVDRTRNSYVVPLLRKPMSLTQQVDTGYVGRFHVPPAGRYSTQ
jgi:hypothetical protein